jgi:hypothetical protein
MADAEIRETTIAPDSAAVRLQISDAPLNSESATTLLDVTVRLPEHTGPLLLAQLQRQVIHEARRVLGQLEDRLLQEIRKEPHIDVEPRLAQRS